MKIKLRNVFFYFRNELLMNVMRSFIFLCCVTAFSFTSNGALSQNSKIKIDANKTLTVDEVFDLIMEQTDYKFIYQEGTFKKFPLVVVKKGIVSANDLLQKSLSSGNFNVILSSNNTVIIEKRIEIVNEEQGFKVLGTITDENSQPLPGANIIEKGTTNGAQADFDGKFSLNIANGNATLVISYLGFLPQEIAVNKQTNITIILKEDTAKLDEVVVVGYGTARRKDISGAVSSIKLEDSPTALAPNSNILQALQGSIAGINVGVQTSPGTNPSILVRGRNSINGSNNPLIVLDGIIYLGGLADINPDDIASIDVLKDASSAAVYGSRAANGVIVITSKKGKSEKPSITFSSSIGVNEWANRPNFMSRDRWIEKFIAQSPNIDSVEDIIFDGVTPNRLFEQGVDTDWVDLIARNGITQNHQAAVSGRSKGTTYYFSGGYSDNEGVILGDEFTRISVRTKLDTKISDWLEVGLDGAYNNNDFSGVEANISRAFELPPHGFPYRWETMPENPSIDNGTLLERYPIGQSIENPLWGTDGTIEDVDKRNFFRLATYALFKVPSIDGLTYRFNYSINSNANIRERFTFENFYIQENSTEPFIDRYSKSEIAKGLTQANGYNQRENNYNYVMDNILNYKKQFGDHYIDATLVATRDYTYSKRLRASGTNFAANGNTQLGVNGIHFAETQSNDIEVIERSNVGYAARLSYAYDNKYHLTATARRDGASVFGNENKFGNFGSIGAAWTMSEEDFLTDSKTLNYLKVKASYGTNGNQGLDPYQTLATVVNGFSGGNRYQFSNAPSTSLYGIGQNALGNTALGWEATTAFNGGFQSAWLNNRVFLDLDFYFSETRDQIFLRSIPIFSGFSSIFSSLGQVNNRGIEISLRTVNIDTEDFKWSSGVNFWKNRNKVASLYGEDLDNDGVEDDDIGNGLFIGKPLGAIFGYEYDGVVQEDDTEYIANTGALPGDAKYTDISGPDGVPDGLITADYDRKILGYETPNFRMNFSNTLEYKNFTFYMLVTGVFGGGKDNFYLGSNPLHNSFRDRSTFNEVDHGWWTPENASEKYLRADFADNRYLGLQSRGFVRIQDINLSYKLPVTKIKGIGLQSLELYTSVKNLHVFTNWFGGGDPEAGIRTAQGNITPVPRTYLMGIKARF
ncbi:TonB-dependent receptor [uncultured Maribacter sp.]|uniref:SusC/RagA family TonB-linked outer membrane protein n=1 Tax=uncultured Maribacter sp. TaxID=431308 RepID=UPI002614EA51|nr:TonB-dependent receptor [uncultured Maribacter sp.]